MLDRKQLKQQAKQTMRAARPAPFWVALALEAIMVVLTLLIMSLDGTLQAIRTMYAGALQGRMVYAEPQAAGGLIGQLLGLALEIMIMEMSVGFVIYAVRVWRQEKAGCGDLFDGFGMFFRSIGIQILPWLMVSLWSLIYAMPVTFLAAAGGQLWWLAAGLPLLLPAIMAAYSYRQAVYIMLDNPGASCLRCMALSREMMRGHRWELFVLDLSFLGWMLLCTVIPVAGMILMVWVTVYRQVVCAGYYDKLAQQ